MRLTQWFDELRSDLKFAMRQLKASPGFTLVAARVDPVVAFRNE